MSDIIKVAAINFKPDQSSDDPVSFFCKKEFEQKSEALKQTRANIPQYIDDLNSIREMIQFQTITHRYDYENWESYTFSIEVSTKLALCDRRNLQTTIKTVTQNHIKMFSKLNYNDFEIHVTYLPKDINIWYIRVVNKKNPAPPKGLPFPQRIDEKQDD